MYNQAIGSGWLLTGQAEDENIVCAPMKIGGVFNRYELATHSEQACQVLFFVNEILSGQSKNEVIKMLVRIAGIISESFVDGVGIRFAIFLQGCKRNCKGCQNPETHNLNGGKILETDFIISEFKKNPLLDGITLTGGEPLLQINAATELARAAKISGLNVWCYTGFTFEEIKNDAKNFLDNIDILVDGEYVEKLRDLSLKFRGSKNQRIIDIKKTLEQNKIILWSE